MEHYSDISVNEREYRDALAASRHDSASSVAKAAAHQTALRQEHATERSSSYQSFPSPSDHSSNHSVHRTDSSSSNAESDQRLEAEYARYTNAPPPYAEKEYEGKDEEEQTYMRMTDYAKEISRMMGRQLVSGMKLDKSEQGKGDEKAM
jgi:hypothetical protein